HPLRSRGERFPGEHQLAPPGSRRRGEADGGNGAGSYAMSSAASSLVALSGSPLLPTFHRDSPRSVRPPGRDVNPKPQDVVVRATPDRSISAHLVAGRAFTTRCGDGQASHDPGVDRGESGAPGGGRPLPEPPDRLRVRRPEPGVSHVGLALRPPRG